ncbi:MAG: adenylate kinase [Chloroflexia bacterium]|nr:adenylate kinase [Chloroflexia bacterium]
MHVILMGAQGSGKGTQASLLEPRLKLVKIATGDLFRAEIASGSPLGVELKAILGRGDLVPDALTTDVVRGRIAALIVDRKAGKPVVGALFDGFPRTDAQARSLDAILEGHGERLTTVIEIVVPRDTLVERLSGRRVCETCAKVFHIVSNPAPAGDCCDNCGGRVIQREDDMPEPIARRLALYDQQTAPLLDYYRSLGILERVDGDQPVEAVTSAILTIVDRRLAASGTA